MVELLATVVCCSAQIIYIDVMKYPLRCIMAWWLLLHAPPVHAQWQPHPSPTTFTVRDIQFLNPTHGFLCGIDGIFRTTDGGDTWSKIRFTSFDSIYMNGCAFYAVHFFDPI